MIPAKGPRLAHASRAQAEVSHPSRVRGLGPRAFGANHVRRRGGVLVEFALVALVLYLLFAAIVELGRATFLAQAAQDAVRVAARELALMPLPAEAGFEQALADPRVLERVFDPTLLVVDLETSGDLDAFFAAAPLVNQALRPLMILDRPVVDGVQRRFLRFPGALLKTADDQTFTVGVPRVVQRDGDGIETIEWLPVLEEIRPGAFSALGPDGGVAALRINVPYQAASLGSFREAPGGPFEPNLAFANLADDGAVEVLQDGALGIPAAEGGIGAYAGPYGLGRLLALGEEIRPFRKLISAQAVFRRESFE